MRPDDAGITGRRPDGIGRVAHGEVGLIFAGIGASLTVQRKPVLPQGVFSAIVPMVLVTTLLAPVGLRWAFRQGDRK